MIKTYSIVEARKHFSKLVNIVEEETAIQLTRRGKVLAILLSPAEYERLQNQRPSFWDAYVPFRQRLDEQAIDLDPDTVFKDIRDQA